MALMTGDHTQGDNATIGQAQTVSQAADNNAAASAYLRSQGIDPNSATIVQFMDAMYQTGQLSSSEIEQGAGGGGSDLTVQNGHITNVGPSWFQSHPWIFAALGLGAAAGAELAGVAATEGGADAATTAATDTAATTGGDAATTATEPTLAQLTGATGPGDIPTATATPSLASTPAASDYAPVAGSTSTGSTLSNLTNAGKAISALGSGLSNAGQAMGQNNLNQEELALQANQQNITGQNNLENQLLALANLEQQQRNTGLKDIYKQSVATTGRTSPYDPAGPVQYSPQYLSTLNSVAGQDQSMLSQPAKYNAATMPTPTGVPQLPINNLPGATNTNPSTLQNILGYTGPAVSTLGALAQTGVL